MATESTTNEQLIALLSQRLADPLANSRTRSALLHLLGTSTPIEATPGASPTPPKRAQSPSYETTQVKSRKRAKLIPVSAWDPVLRDPRFNPPVEPTATTRQPSSMSTVSTNSPSIDPPSTDDRELITFCHFQSGPRDTQSAYQRLVRQWRHLSKGIILPSETLDDDLRILNPAFAVQEYFEEHHREDTPPSAEPLNDNDLAQIALWSAIYGDNSDSEGEDMSDTHSFIEELEQERPTPSLSKDFLSKDEVTDIIHQAINAYTARWTKKKLPIKDSQARNFWLEFEDAEARKDQIEDCRKALGRYTLNIKRIVEGLGEVSWSSKTSLLKQCECIELSVGHRLTCEWQIRTLESDTPPPAGKPITRTAKRDGKNSKMTENSDVVSESDEVDSEEEHSDFMDIDGFQTADELAMEHTEFATASKPGEPRTSVEMDVDEIDISVLPGSDMSCDKMGVTKDLVESQFGDMDVEPAAATGNTDLVDLTSTSLPMVPSEVPSEVLSKLDEDEDFEGDIDDDDLPLSHIRKRSLKRSQKAKLDQDEASRRLDENHERALHNLNKLQLSQIANDDDDLPTCEPINAGKLNHEDYVFPNSKARKVLQAHQIEGLQFLWREVVQGKGGCLLSHTMGLGKTLQTITFLVALADAVSKEAVRPQIPVELHTIKFLILCPPSLISNWLAELQQWLPPGLRSIGEISCVTGDLPVQERHDRITNWSENGGVLINVFSSCRSASRAIEIHSLVL